MNFGLIKINIKITIDNNYSMYYNNDRRKEDGKAGETEELSKGTKK